MQRAERQLRVGVAVLRRPALADECQPRGAPTLQLNNIAEHRIPTKRARRAELWPAVVKKESDRLLPPGCSGETN
jgi:hypothetical protein